MASAAKRLNIPLKATGGEDGVAATDRGGSSSKVSARPPKGASTTRGASPRGSKSGSDSARGASPSARGGGTTPRSKAGKKGVDKPVDAKAKPGSVKGDLSNPLGGGGKAGKPSAAPLDLFAQAAAEKAGASSSPEPKEKGASKGKGEAGTTLGPNQKKIEFFTEELLARKPLDAKARDALVKKSGPPKQEVQFERNENHRPIGRADELTPSRHERIPPANIVLMFNCFEASFQLLHGDLSTLPEADTSELRSLTSGKSLGRVKITPEKGTPIEERVEFTNEWKVGAEHGVVHDGLQADGYIELRLDWKAASKKAGEEVQSKVAILRVNPWLAYGCGDGARLAIRKPGATESTASTLQRALRDDYVVVRRDGSDSELTVDPTPFTVVPSSNARHKPGTRLLIVHENACVDAVVEPWPEVEVDIKDGSRHLLRVSPKEISGWVTMQTPGGQDVLVRREEVEGAEPSKDGTKAPSPPKLAPPPPPVENGATSAADAAAPAAAPGEEPAEDFSGVWISTRKKAVAIHSGCNPNISEKFGMLTNKMPVRILEVRQTEDSGVRANISTLPSQANILYTAALNEFNHSVQRFPSVAEYEAARINYLEDIVVREAHVEDAITGNNLRIKDQTLHISTATEAQDNNRTIPPEWNVSDVRDLVKLLLIASPNRVNGSHSTQPVLVRAGPGTGKTWMAKQAVFTLADRLLSGKASNDGIRLVPIVVFVQRIIYLLREGSATTEKGADKNAAAPEKRMSLLERYIQSVYSGKKMESWQTMLMQAYDMRALVVLLDGVDEAAGLRDQIENFVHKEIVPSGNRVLVTSRPEGVHLPTYSKTFIVMNLCQLTNEQQRRVINIQMQGNIFFDHLLSLGEVRKKLDDAYRKVSNAARNDLETMFVENLWLLEDFHAEADTGAEKPATEVSASAQKSLYDPAQRQKEVNGIRMVQENMSARTQSAYLKGLDADMRSDDTPCKLSLLERLDSVCSQPTKNIADPAEFESQVLDGMLGANGAVELRHRVAVRLGMLVQKQREATAAASSPMEKGKVATNVRERRNDDSNSAVFFFGGDSASMASAKAPKGASGFSAALGKGGPAKADTSFDRYEGLGVSETAWMTLIGRTDEIYVAHEAAQELFKKLIVKFVTEAARDDEEAAGMVTDVMYAPMKDPVRLHEKAMEEQYRERFRDGGLAEACISDVTRARISLRTGVQIKEFIEKVRNGVMLAEEQEAAIKPSQRGKEAEREADLLASGEPPPPIVTEIKLMHMNNKFENLDPTHFRMCTCVLRVQHKQLVFYCEVEVHYFEIMKLARGTDPTVHYQFFRKRLQGHVPEHLLDGLLEEKLVFLVDATGIPVLLSLLVLIFTAGGEDLTKLPSNRIELYDLGIDSAISKRLLPGNRTSTDQLVHDWLRLFNLDRSAMAAISEGTTEKKEREHRPTRKAALSMELSNHVTEQKMAAEAEAANKKKTTDNSSANKGDRKLFNLDQKEVYEVFKHGAHYLREANKPEVQRTELNRIELSMPKKLVDTVMMLVNSNLKMLLGGKSQQFGLTMLRHVAVSNQLAGRREFSAVHVAKALLIDQMNPEGLTLWMHLNKEDAGLPLTKTLEAQTELAPAQYQFKHLSFQEGLFAQHLLIQAEAGWEGWETDETASTFLNNPFMNNTCRIAAGFFGTRLSKRRPTWDFSAAGTQLTDVGLQALWLICEKNEKLKVLNLKNNGVGAKPEDSMGLMRMLTTSTALVNLNISNNALGELGPHIKSFGRGISANKTLTTLNVSNNRLLPEGIKVVCNALRTCTLMRDLDVSYNSPGREAALAGMLQVHPTLRSFGVIEKEPTTRSERTFWLDTRGKEAIGRALLDSPGTVMYLQCDVFSIVEKTTTLLWTSRAPCDAIVLAGVLRSNSTLTSLNLAATGDIGDYEREELGRALLTNPYGKVGFCDIYRLQETTGNTYLMDLKDKDQIRSRRSFTLFAGLLRANSTLTCLTLSSIQPEHIDVLAEALATNTTMKELKLEQPSKSADTAIATLPVQLLNGAAGADSIDLSEAGVKLTDASGGFQPCHRHACGVVGAILGASANTSIRRLKINPGGGAEGGAVLEHLHRAKKSSLCVLDLTGIGLGDRGGAKIFETLIEGKCDFLNSLHLGDNGLTDLAVGRLMVETLRNESCRIQTLDLNNNQIGAHVMTQAIKFNKSLTSLDITGSPIDDDGLGLIGDALLQEFCSVSMRFLRCFAFDVQDGASELVLNGEVLGVGATQLLCGVFKYNNLIKKLNLGGRGIQTTAASLLAISVKHNTTLTSIDLSANPMSDVSQYTGKEASDTNGLLALAEAVKGSSSLQWITLDGSKLPVDSLKGEDGHGGKEEGHSKGEGKGESKHDKKVRMLDLSRKSLGFVSAIFIGTLLRGNSYMAELILHSNELTPAGATIVVKQLLGSLKTLDIANIVHVEERAKGEKSKDKKSSVQQVINVPPEALEALWAAVSSLNTLEKLTMDRDHLRDLKDLGKLLSLKTLSLANNKLTSLPDDLNRIRGLKQMILSGNQLRDLHHAVGDLELLEKLDLRQNQIKFLPASISRLRNLKQLDASENLITALEPSICDLHECEKLELKDNPLHLPPAATARQGIGAIRKFFQEIVQTNSLGFHAARLILLGHTDTGKTTLQRALRVGTAPPTRDYEPTMYLDTQYMVVGEAAKQKKVSMWDLSGSPSHMASMQQYIVDGSVYLLCVPALEVLMLNAQYADYVGRFLDQLELSAPRALVLPVVTKADLLVGGQERGATQLDNAATAQCQWVLDAINRHQAAIPEEKRTLRVQRQCTVVSSITGGDSSLEALRTRIEGLLLAEPLMLQTVGQTIPRALHLSMVFLRALRDGRDPIDSARAADLGYIPSAMSNEQKRCRPYMPYEDANKIFMEEFVPALKLPVSSDDGIREAMKLLQANGECVHSVGGMIYLQPDHISRLIRPMCDDRMGNRLWQGRSLPVLETVRSATTGLAISDHERVCIVLAAEHFAKTGELREELLPILWEPLGVKRDDYGEVLMTLAMAGMVILSENTQLGRRWLMPARVPDTSIHAEQEAWAEAVEGLADTEALRMNVVLGACNPPGVLERLLVACQGLGQYRRVWKSGNAGAGAHLVTHSLSDVSHLRIEVRQNLGTRSFVRRSSTVAMMDVPKDLPKAAEEGAPSAGDANEFSGYELTLEAVGSKDNRLGVWASLLHVRKLAQEIIDEMPELNKRATYGLCCPGCMQKGLPEPMHFPVEMVLKKMVTCEKCSETLHLETADASTRVANGATSLSLINEPPFDEPEYRHAVNRLRYGRPLEAYVGLAALLGLADSEEVDELKALGEMAILKEIAKHHEGSDAARSNTDDNGWAALDWAYYLSDPPATDDYGNTNTSPHARRHSKLVLEAKGAGIDATHKSATLDYFATRPDAQRAGLTRGHVLALRLFSSPVQQAINRPLHDGCSRKRPHPYPALVILLLEALWKLKAAQADARIVAVQQAAKLLDEAQKAKLNPDEDDDSRAALTKKATQAALHAEAVQQNVFWLGISRSSAAEFKERGGTEIAFTSVTRSRKFAQEDSMHAFNRLLAELTRDLEAMGKSTAMAAGAAEADRNPSPSVIALANGVTEEADEVEEGGDEGSDEEVEDNEDDGEIVYLALAPKAAEVNLDEVPLSPDMPPMPADFPPPPRRASIVLPVEDDADEGSSPSRSSPSISPSPLKRRKSRDSRASNDSPVRIAMEEMPVLLLKVFGTPDTMPVDIGFLTVVPDEQACVYPLGAFFEQRRESKDTLGTADDGEEALCTCVEVAMHLLRASGLKSKKNAQAAQAGSQGVVGAPTATTSA